MYTFLVYFRYVKKIVRVFLTYFKNIDIDLIFDHV